MTFAEQFLKSRFSATSSKKALGLLKGFGGQRLPKLTSDQIRVAKSNTTVFAFCFDGGAIITGDRRMVEGLDLWSDMVVKIMKLSKFSALAFAGSCHTIQHIEEDIEGICESFNRRYGKELSPEGQANLLRSLLEPWWYLFVFFDYCGLSVPILAAFDEFQNKPRLFRFDETGFYIEQTDPPLVGTGCGFDAVRGLLIEKLQRRETINYETALDLSVRAMTISGITSIGVSDTRVTLPTIAVADAEGFKWIKPEDITLCRDRISTERRETK